jgi:hypothetical protein
MTSEAPRKPITETTIPGTKVPDITKAEAESAEARRFMSRVAVTTAILATLASIASMFSTSHLNQAMLDQIKTADQWSFFQAKGVKLAVLESKLELVRELGKPPEPADTERVERYKKEQAEIRATAESRESDATDHRKRHTTLGRASTAFQVAIALSAVALLVKRPTLWWISIALGAVGSAFMTLGMV